MASTKLEVSELDFDTIKRNLKIFLSQQTEFSDYNFEGSGLSVLLDVLAYNTHYLAFNANVLANELYIDSASGRNNVVSLAKMLNYRPKSSTASQAVIDITVQNATGSSITMAKGTRFNSSINGNSYYYVTNEDITIQPVDGIYKFSNVTLYEGTLTNFNFTYASTDADFRFVLPSPDIDTGTLKVSVQNSASDTTTNTYTLSENYQNINSDSLVYFLQETETGEFEIYFGDGIFGKALSNGNIVKCEYIISNRGLGNGATTFTLSSGSVGGFTDVSITTISNSQGGSNEEGTESVRFNAPLSFTAQNRAVTTTDYETKTLEIYPNASSITAWGGEDEETPVYGTVKIAIKPKSGSTLTETTKNSIVTSLKTFNVASVTPQIVDPEITNILLTSTVKFNKNKTSLTASDIRTNVITAVSNYNTNNLSRFDGVFRYSKVTSTIDATDNSIISNITSIRMRKTFSPTLNSSTTYNVYFRNAIYNPHSGHNTSAGGVIETSGFKVDGDTTNVYFLDDDGAGNLRRYRLEGQTRVYVNNTQGTVDYTAGSLTISSINIASIENIRSSASTVIEITTTPSSNDIVPVRGQVIEIDTSNSSFTVEEDTFEGGSSDAGIGYTTASVYTSSSTNY